MQCCGLTLDEQSRGKGGEQDGTQEFFAWDLTCPRMGPSGGPGAACPDLTMARIMLFTSSFLTALAALEIFDMVVVGPFAPGRIRRTKTYFITIIEKVGRKLSPRRITVANHLHGPDG